MNETQNGLTVGAARGLISVAGKEAARFALNGVEFRGGWATATDGRRLLRVPVEGTPEEGVIVAPECLKAAATGGKARDVIRASFDQGEGKLEREGGATFPASRLEGSFPDSEQIVPKHPEGQCIRIGFSAGLLAGLLKAMAGNDYTDTVAFSITLNKPECSALRLDGPGGTVAAIMPVLLESGLPQGHNYKRVD